MLAAPAIVVLILVQLGLEQLHLPYTGAVNFQSWCCVPEGNTNKARFLAMLEARAASTW